jgi:hypothetical protein
VEPLAPPASLKASLMASVRGDEPEVTPLRRRLAALVPAAARVRPAVALASVALLLGVGLATGFGIARLASGDGIRTVAVDVDRAELPGARGTLSLSGEGEKGGILRVNGMPSPGKARVYQAWVEREGELQPQPTFEVGSGGVGAVAVPGDLSDADAVLVTREQRGGARVPSEKPVLRVRL